MVILLCGHICKASDTGDLIFMKYMYLQNLTDIVDLICSKIIKKKTFLRITSLVSVSTPKKLAFLSQITSLMSVKLHLHSFFDQTAP